MTVRMTALAAAFLMLLCAAGCSEDKKKEKTVSASDVNRTADGVYFDNGKTFCRGVWAADDGEKLIGYYVFSDEGNGRFDEIQMGMGIPFKVKADGANVDFNLGAADFSDPAKVEITEKGKRVLTWTNDKRTENLTLLGEQEPDAFCFHTRADLEEMAQDYYESVNGKRPVSTGITYAADGTAFVLLYNQKGKKIGEYAVDPITAKGVDMGTKEEIQLVRKTDGE